MRSNKGWLAVAAVWLFAACNGGSTQAQVARHAGVSSASGLDAVETVAWKAEVKNSSRPFRADGRLWVVSKDKLIALAESDGAASEGIALGSVPTSPVVVVDGSAIFGGPKKLRAVSMEGEELWSAKLTATPESAPVVTSGTVFVAAKALHAIDARSGEELWKFASDGSILGSPSVADAKVYVTDSRGKMFAIDAASGQAVWEFDARVPYVPVAVAITRELAVAPTADGWVVATVLANGREKWRFPTRDALSSAVAADRTEVYAGTEAGAVFAINSRTGQRLWAHEGLAAVVTQPVYAGGRLYVGTDDGNVHALDATTGERVWSYQLEAEPIGMPVIGNGEIFVGDGEGRVYALE